jgi:ATP-binding cassette subfamily B protein
MSQQKALGALNGHVQEMYTGHTIVTAFGHEARSMKEFETLNDAYSGAAWRAQFSSGLIMPVMMFVGNIGYVAVAVVGGFVTRQTITIGDVQAFIQMRAAVLAADRGVEQPCQHVQLTIVSAERVFELLDEPEEPAGTPDAQIIGVPRATCTSIASASATADVPLIDDMDIHVESGKMIAIVGPTGAGKTTLVNLLMRFYDVTGGAITVDGHDIRDLKRGPLRRIFGMVLQDTWLFSGTIRENVAYGLEGATEQQIVKAAKAAQADHFIRTLPENYNTVINWEASNLSQGQKQLLTIARAFLADPAILILDETTSSVDTRTECTRRRCRVDEDARHSSLHRLSTIRNSISFDDGARAHHRQACETLLRPAGTTQRSITASSQATAPP